MRAERPRRARGGVALGATVVLSLLLAGCGDSAAVACSEMCDAALDRFEACLDESGQDWGASVGYESPTDHANACETFAWELRELGQGDSCAARRATFADGTCDDYYDAWEVE